MQDAKGVAHQRQKGQRKDERYVTDDQNWRVGYDGIDHREKGAAHPQTPHVQVRRGRKGARVGSPEPVEFGGISQTDEKRADQGDDVGRLEGHDARLIREKSFERYETSINLLDEPARQA